MAIDPKAAAMAAQAAAAAAETAAREAAAATEAAEAGGTEIDGKTPTLAETTAERVLEETEATGAGAGQLDGTSMSSVLSRDANLMDAGSRDALAALPGLDSAVSSGSQGGLASPFDLGSSFQSNQNPGFGTDSISTIFRVNIETDDAELVTGGSGKREAVVVDGEVWQRWDEARASGGADSGSTDGSADSGDEEEWQRWDEAGGGSGDADATPPSSGGGASGGDSGGQAPNPSPVDPVVGGEEEEDEEDDDVIVVSNDSGGGGSTGVARPAPDEYGGYTGSWSGVTPIGPGSGDDDVVAGATGSTGSGAGGTIGPQGGSWAINPGAEGFVAGRETDLRDAEAWYGGGVGQPGSPDLELAGGDPTIMDQGIPTVDPNTVDPSGGEGSTSDAGAQASTAYRTIAAPAQAASAPDATDEGWSNGSADGPGTGMGAADADPAALAGGLAADHDLGMGVPFEDPAASMAPLSDDDGGHGQGRGRDFGQSQGRGEGRDKDDDADLE